MKPKKHNDFAECITCGKEEQLYAWECEACRKEAGLKIKSDREQMEAKLEQIKADSDLYCEVLGFIHDEMERQDFHMGSVINELSKQKNLSRGVASKLVYYYINNEAEDIGDTDEH